MRIYPLHATDFQACMYGSTRDKWTRIVASFPEIVQMDAVCDRKHSHSGWGFTTNAAGHKVWATAEESQCPRKLCIALVQLVLQVATQRGVVLKPESSQQMAHNPLQSAKHSRVAAGEQPRGAKPCGSRFSAVGILSGKRTFRCAVWASAKTSTQH